MLGILEGEPGGKQGRSGRPLGTWRPQEGGDFVPRQQVLASGLCGHRASPLLSWSPVEGRGTAICAIPAWWLPSAEGEWARGLGARPRRLWVAAGLGSPLGAPELALAGWAALGPQLR